MFKVRVITPNGVYGEEDATILNITTPDGMRGILTNHMPIVTPIDIGRMSIGLDSDNYSYRYEYATGNGLLYFRNNKATILLDEIYRSDYLDRAEAEAEKEELLQKLKDRSLEEHLRERYEKELKLAKMKCKIAEQ